MDARSIYADKRTGYSQRLAETKNGIDVSRRRWQDVDSVLSSVLE